VSKDVGLVSSEVLAKVCEVDSLPALPAVAFRVLQATQSDDVSVEEVAKIVGQDPALTAKILKLANSSLFGLSRKVGSLPQAMVVLGMRAVKVLALSFSVAESFSQRRADWFDYQAYWRRSLTIAVAARLVAEEVAQQAADEAFVAGLLSDLGILTLVQAGPGEYELIVRQSAGQHGRLLQAERDLFGLGHPEVAGAMLANWGLPPDLCSAAELHHCGRREGLEEEIARLADIAHVASCVADLFYEDPTQQGLEDLRAMAAETLGLEPERLERILERLDKLVNETANLLSVDIGKTVSYEDVREQAVLQLAQLSVRSEVERAAAEQREALSNERASQWHEAAFTDGLSRIANRAAFDKHLDEMIEQCSNGGKPVGLIMCDVDDFKRINDTYGHPVGDEVIRMAGAILRQYQAPDVFVARYGGDEFALIIHKCKFSRLVALSKDVCNRLRQLRAIGKDGTIKVSVSVGGASTEALERPDAQALLALADKFLYLAKRSGKGRACVSALPRS